MHLAAQGGNLDIFNVLCKYGAALNIVNDVYDTPLHVAIRHGHEDFGLALVAKLLQIGQG